MAKAMAEVDQIVRARLEEKGWPVAMSADERTVTGLAWERIKLRCGRSDTESLKRLKRLKKGAIASRRRVTGRRRP